MATTNTSGAIQRITKEIASIQNSTDLSLAVAFRDSDVRNVRALIIGPPDTPYEFGFFEFDIKFGREYPIKPPDVQASTTNNGKCRFNPNIYNCGKVCLSILGTWRGQPGEEWSSAQGLESILLSIQSLLSPNPYENEPGHETAKKEEELPRAYVAKIRHETLRIAVIQRLEGLLGIDHNKVPSIYKSVRSKTEDLLKQSPMSASGSKSPSANEADDASTPNTDVSAYEYDAETTFKLLENGTWDPFADLIKRRFLWYHDSYMKSIEVFSKEQPDGKAFSRMEFEYPPNSMEGHFDYKGLHKRLDRIGQALEEERLGWEKQGATQVEEGTQLATQLAFNFKQLELRWNQSQYSGSKMEVSLPDPKNPFVWRLTLFGRPVTNLDGGIFNMTFSIPPTFPETQPRLKFETPIFHHRVSSQGYLCYFPEKEDEIASHLAAIAHAIDDDNPVYDPRAPINPGAFLLFWGGEEKRKFYNRKLRRSAQESSEY